MRPNWAGIVKLITSALLAGAGLTGCATDISQHETGHFSKQAEDQEPVIVLDFDTTHMDEQQVYWLQQINQFFVADVETVVTPYIDLVQRLNTWPEETYCNEEHQRSIEHALELNNTSLMAYRFNLHCANMAGDEIRSQQIQQNIELISALLLQSGSGETPLDAIKIRDLHEAQILFNGVGISLFDMEMVRLANQVVYKVHAMDMATGKYVIYYVENTEYFARKLNLSLPQNGKSKQLAKLQMEDRFQTSSVAAFLWQFDNWLKNDHPELVIQSLSKSDNLGAVATVELAYAYLHSKNIAEFEYKIDDLLTYSENGFVDASAAFGHYMLSTADPFEVSEAAALYKFNVKNLGAEEATIAWLNGFLNLPVQGNAFDLLLDNLDEEYFPYWRNAINLYNSVYGLITPLVNQKLTYLLQRLGDRYPRAKLDYAHVLLNGHWDNQQDIDSGLQIVKHLAEQGYTIAQLDYGIFYTFARYGLPIDRQAAFSWYYKAAEQGDKSALYNVGLGYRFGRGTTKDLLMAIDFFEQAIDAGFGLAGCRIGDLYADEEELRNYQLAAQAYTQVIDNPASNSKEKANCAYGLAFVEIAYNDDIEEGIKRFNQAADLGEKAAMFELGILYRDGKLVERNIDKSIEYYRRAAEHGSYRAAANIGYIYEHGDGVEIDNAKALSFYQFSAHGGNATGQNNYATFLRHGTVVEKDVTAAIDWYQKSILQGNAYAAENLADIYYFGELNEPDFEQACNYYEKAIELGAEHVLYDLGYCYFYGEGREQNTAKGLEIFELSASKQNQNTLVELGYIYASGEIIDINPQKSEAYYLAAYAMQNPDAAFGLAKLHESDNGIKKDLVLSTVYYEQSAKWGSVEGMLATARAYMQGVGTKSDAKKAQQWLKKALEKGSEEAKLILKSLH